MQEMSPTLTAYQKKKFRQKMRRWIKLALGGGLILLGLVTAVAFLSHWEGLAVQSIDIKGLDEIAEEEVRQLVEDKSDDRLLGVFSRQSIFFFPRQNIVESLVQEYPRISSAVISPRSFSEFREFELQISEREAHVLWCLEDDKDPQSSPVGSFSGSCYFADESGYLFAPAPVLPRSAIFHYYDGGKGVNSRYPLPEESFEQVEKFRLAIEEQGLTPIAVQQVAQYSEFRLFLKGGGYLYFSVYEGWDLSAERLLRLLRKKRDELLSDQNELKVEYIDLRYGNRIYYLP